MEQIEIIQTPSDHGKHQGRVNEFLSTLDKQKQRIDSDIRMAHNQILNPMKRGSTFIYITTIEY